MAVFGSCGFTVHSFFSFVFSLVSLILLASGIMGKMHVDNSEYKEAVCYVYSASKFPKVTSRQGTTRTYGCDYTLTTSITGVQTFKIEGRASVNQCTEFGQSCDYSLASSCNSACWVVYKDGAADEVSMGSQDLAATSSIVCLVLGVILLPVAAFCIYAVYYAVQNDGDSIVLVYWSGSRTKEAPKVDAEMGFIDAASKEASANSAQESLEDPSQATSLGKPEEQLATNDSAKLNDKEENPPAAERPATNVGATPKEELRTDADNSPVENDKKAARRSKQLPKRKSKKRNAEPAPEGQLGESLPAEAQLEQTVDGEEPRTQAE
mmetsp:Transcript_99893/g.187943  ORF Transcript_99893/g.187943 Transcript_99893/m.187943 type:complete len:323 (-) Transcript_99893:67-1035(-)